MESAASDHEATADTDMSAWSQLGLHPELIARLGARGFARPTPIQAACLLPALHGRRDIVGAAETGSGKTLAFGLPIMQRWLEARDSGEPRDGLFGLIITPTRELALQVADHLRALMPVPDATCARVVTLVGGMAAVKQKRLLQARPEVVVATPGRLWELLSADPQPYLRTLHQLRFFVLDEVDRMVDAGHFKELDNILQLLQQRSNGGSGVEGEEEPAEGEAGGGTVAKAAARQASPRQIFLFSATLMLPPNAKESNAKKLKAHKAIKSHSTMERLLSKLKFQNALKARHTQPRAATHSHTPPHTATRRHTQPRAATRRHAPPRAATRRHTQPRAATHSHVTPHTAT